ncbi:hypothetical protein LCGC14_0520990 [marine sediment metagenome]|uniref:Uncharacterized protein n=1 Tax=marine sediment metagenome TaxID=412755 RepID=A0A0F9UJW8_9ZZZZ
MAGKLNVYDIGQGGVNSSKSPIHLDTTELTKGQNVVLDTAGAEGGIRKRGGLPKLNGTAMQGKINGAISVPIADESAKTQTLYAALEVSSGSNTWRTSTDGTTWAFATAPAKITQHSKLVTGTGFPSTLTVRVASVDGKLYYPSDSYTQFNNANHQRPPLRVYDGTSDEPFGSVPYSPSEGDTTNAYVITDMLAANGKVYFVSADGGASVNDPARVFEGNPATGQITQIGPEIGGGATGYGPAVHLAWYNSRLWIGVGNISGQILSIRPGLDTSWVVEHTVASKYISGLGVFEGLLYAGTGSTASEPTVLVRSSLGVWSNTDTGGPSGADTYITSGFTVYNSELYVVLQWTAGANGSVSIRKFDGSSWTEDEDITSSFPGGGGGILQVPGNMLVFGDNMYLAMQEQGGTGTPSDPNGAILKNASGSWTKVDDLSARGWMGVVTA